MAETTGATNLFYDILTHGLFGSQPHELAALGLNVGVMIALVAVSIALLRTRSLAAETRARDLAELEAERRRRDRAVQLLALDPHVLVVWGEGDEPTIEGDVALLADLPAPRRVLAFGSWLPPAEAVRVERAVETLRTTGTAFHLEVATIDGRAIEIHGAPLGGRAVARFRAIDGVRSELTRTRTELARLDASTATIRTFLDAVITPAWIRDEHGRLTWVNAAYARATDAAGAADAVARRLELLDAATRAELSKAPAADGTPRRVNAIAAGSRRLFDVIECATGAGTAGLAIDVTEIETMRTELRNVMLTHERTLDQLTTAVAIFDARKRLVFHNDAYRQLWGLDASFLHLQPTDGDILDRLREMRRLPEKPSNSEHRIWKRQLFELYQSPSLEPVVDDPWYLPNGQVLRVIRTPDPAGGVAYVFEDMTEQIKLETRVAAVEKVRRETLDNLEEAVAVFGPDGRLSLHNPAFARLWDIDPAILDRRPAIDLLGQLCAVQLADTAAWPRLMAAVTVVPVGGRLSETIRLDRRDHSIVDVRTAPLPDGATLVTFRNVTDAVVIQRALTDRNEALEAASRIKSDFVQHMSYQLRTPLTTIIGFAQVLDDPAIGPLTPRQREYLGFINVSSASLLSIIDDVLDLATIDAGVMELELGPVDILSTIRAASDAVQDRLQEHDIRLETRAAPGIGEFVADGGRVRQILFNLLSNAIGFTPAGGMVVLDAEKTADEVVFVVRDRGPGIPNEFRDKIFDRFESRTAGTRHRGAGLGLAIVASFVKLHAGRIAVDPTPGGGTTVTVAFPLRLAGLSQAAE